MDEIAVILKDRNGTDVIYEGVNAVKLNKVGGGTQIFSAGEAIESIPIALDLREGHQTVEAPEGYLVKSAVIQKPNHLTSENIKEGVTIAGVEGNLFVPAVVETTVDIDFSEGDMAVTPEDGTAFGVVNIPKPENLTKDKIKHGVRIAGIEGEFIGDTEEKTIDGTNDLTFANGDFVITPSEETKVISRVTITPPEALKPENIVQGVEIAGVTGTFNLAAEIVSRTATDIYLPEVHAGGYAFYKYPTANSATVKSAGVSAFEQADFETVTLTGDAIYDYSFYNSKVKRVIAPNVSNLSLPTTSGSYSFDSSRYLEQIDMPNFIFKIGHTRIFQGCSMLKEYKNTAVCARHQLDSYIFNNCTALESVDFLSPIHIVSVGNFNNCPSLKRIIMRGSVVYTSSVALNNSLSGSPDAIFYVPLAMMASYESSTYWNEVIAADRMRAIEGGINVFGGDFVLYNQTVACSAGFYRAMGSENTEGETVTATVVSNNTEIATVSDVVVNEDTIDFNLNTLAVEGDVDITITLTIGEYTFEKTATFSVMETLPLPTYSVSSAGASYTFTLNSTTGYYVSGNKGKNNSCALCKVTFNTQGKHLYLDCISYGENNYDFGILSNVDTTLGTTYTVDSTNVFKSFKGLSSASVQTVDYGEIAAGEHFIYVKYRKDSGSNSGNDTLQFKVRFE